MAKLRYTKTVDRALYNLDDNDLRVLDIALANLKDKLTKGARDLCTVGDTNALNALHDQVLAIKVGVPEEVDE